RSDYGSSAAMGAAPPAVRQAIEGSGPAASPRSGSLTPGSNLMVRDPRPATRPLHIPLLPPPELDPSRLHEAIVLAQGPVLLDLGHGVEQHADHDQHRGAAELCL